MNRCISIISSEHRSVQQWWGGRLQCSTDILLSNLRVIVHQCADVQLVHPATIWQKIQKYPLPYHQTMKQLHSSGCETPLSEKDAAGLTRLKL